jgi:septal ring factor EnvC (AmiA/AmiB activator)
VALAIQSHTARLFTWRNQWQLKAADMLTRHQQLPSAWFPLPACFLVSAACRKKLAKRGEDLESMQKECDRRNTLLGSITAEKEKLAAALAATQAKLRRVSQEAAAAAAEPVLKVDAAKVGGTELSTLCG